MKIAHHPILNKDKVAEHYSEKDGVPISYVCTSAIGGEAFARDIFYRETPHPEFGNRYFAIFHDPNTRITAQPRLLISSADDIEEAEFVMIEGENGWEYSQHRHDYRKVPGINLCIDGGRAYFRCVGDVRDSKQMEFRIKDGVFTEVVPE